MKNHSVRFLSMLLVIALLIGLSPTSGLAATPTAETLKATNVTTSSAKLGGYVTANGGYEYAGYGFEICEVDSGDHWTVGWVSDNIDSNVNYYYTVTGLEMGTEYEYYFYAVSSSSEIGYDGTVYSNPKKFTTDCDHEYSEWVIDYEYNEEDYAEHSYREKIAYTCEHCDDYYTEWTDYTYEKHNWSIGKGYSECDDCQCELPQIEIYAFSVDDEYSVGETFSFFGSLSGEGSAIKRVAINVKKPGEKSYEHYRKTVDATTFSLTKVDDFEIDKEGEYYIYIWAVDAAENGLNSASAVKDAGTFVYSFTAGEGCSHNDWDYEYGDYEYSDIEDPEVHEYKIYYKKVCADCGKTIETGLTTPEEETHSFNNDGICKKCGYEKVTSAEEIILTSSRTEVTGSGKVEFTTIGDYNSLRIFVKDNATGNVYDYTMTKNGTTYTYKHNFVGIGTKTVWAESGNGTESNKITITVLEAVEKLATPVYIGSTTTTTKEVFIFEWSDVTNAEGYTVFIYNRGAVSDYTNAIADRHVICGFSEAGEATIQICAVADGYTTSDPCNVTITITDPSEDILLTSSRTEVTGSGKVEFTTIGDYNSLRIFVKDNVSGNVYDYPMTKNGTTFTYEHNFVGVGTKTVWAESANGTESNKITITVLEAVEKLATPVYCGETTAVVGEAITFKWDSVANAKGYSLWLYDSSVGIDLSNRITDEQAEYTFTEAGEYSIQIYANAGGYTSSDSCNVTITVSAATLEPEQLASPNIVLSSYRLKVGDKLTVTWNEIENADYYSVVILDCENGNQVLQSATIYSGTNWTSSAITYAGTLFEVIVYACSDTPEQYLWSLPSIRPIEVYELDSWLEQLAPPVISLSSTTLKVGERLTVTWNEIENADYYTAIIWDDEVTEKDRLGFDQTAVQRADIMSGTSWTSGAMTYAGDYFSVGVFARSDIYDMSGAVTERFRVIDAASEPEQLASPVISLSSTTLKVGERLTVTWNDVENADYYTVVIWDMNKPVSGGHQEVQREDIKSGTSWTSSEMTYAGDNFMINVYARSDNHEQYPQSEEKAGYFTVVESEIVETSINTLDINDNEITAESVAVTGKLTFGADESAASYDYAGIQYGIYQSEWLGTINGVLDADGSFTVVISNLTPNTTYAFRAVARNASSQEWLNGNIVVITTKAATEAVAPTIVTHDAETVTESSAVLKGEVITVGNTIITEWGFSWKKDGDIDSSKKVFTGEFTSNLVTHLVEELTPNSAYEYYFYVKSESGAVVNGDARTFITVSDEENLPIIKSVDFVPTEVIDGEEVTFTFRMLNGQQIDFYADVNGQMKKIMRLKADNDMSAEHRLINTASDTFVWKYKFETAGSARRVAFVPILEYHDANDNISYKYGHMTSEYTINIRAYMKVPVDKVDVYSGGGSSSYEVDSNINWAVSSADNWISVNRDGKTIAAKFKANPYSYIRTGSITVADPTGECESCIITATQNPQPKAKWNNVSMANNTQIGISATGALYRDIIYTIQAKNASGETVGIPVTLNNEDTYWKINVAGSGMQLPRAATYSFEVIATRKNGNAYATYNVGSVTIPLYNGSDIIEVRDGSGKKLASGANIPYGETLTVRWEGSYGINSTEVKVYITHEDGSRFKVIDHSAKTHGPGTFTITPEDYGAIDNGRSNANDRAGARAPISPQILIEVTPDMSEVANADSDLLLALNSNRWKGSVIHKEMVDFGYYIDFIEEGISRNISKSNNAVVFYTSYGEIAAYDLSGNKINAGRSTQNDYYFEDAEIVYNGLNASQTTLYSKKYDEMFSSHIALATLIIIKMNPSYIYGCQLGYPEDSDLRYKYVLLTDSAKEVWDETDTSIVLKRIWFELNIDSPLPLPTFDFERYAEMGWQVNYESWGRSWALYTEDTLGNLYNIISDGVKEACKGLNWTATQYFDKDNLANSDKASMAKVIIDGWLKEIKNGNIPLSSEGKKQLEKLAEVENALREATTENEIYEAVKTLLSLAKAIPGYKIAKGVQETAQGIIGAFTNGMAVGEGFSDLQVLQLKRDIQKLKACIISDALKSKALTASLDADLEKYVDDLINSSMNIWHNSLQSTGELAEKMVETVFEEVAGDVLTGVTLGLSVALNVAIGGIMDLAIDTTYYSEINVIVEVLEGATRTYEVKKSQVEDAIAAFMDTPSLTNYVDLYNVQHSGKLQMWVVQCKEMSDMYWTICGLNEGAPARYSGEKLADISKLENYFERITYRTWKGALK